jgi:hypothetical protein
MNEIVMKEKKGPRKKEKRFIRSQRKPISSQEMREKIDELVSLLFEEDEKTSILKERKKK